MEVGRGPSADARGDFARRMRAVGDAALGGRSFDFVGLWTDPSPGFGFRFDFRLVLATSGVWPGPIGQGPCAPSVPQAWGRAWSPVGARASPPASALVSHTAHTPTPAPSPPRRPPWVVGR